MENPYENENWLRHDMETDWVWLPNGRNMSAPAAENHRDGYTEGSASRDAEVSEHHIVIQNLCDALIAEHKKLTEQAEIVSGLVEALESIPAHTLDHDAGGKETMVFRYTAYAIWDTEKRLPAIEKAKGE